MQPITAASARVALLLSLVFLWRALPRDIHDPVSCVCPLEAAGQGTWTVRVGCFAAKASPARATSAEQPGAEPIALRGSIRGPARLLFNLPIDLRQADAETLMVLPGIGAARAQAILALREAGGLNAVSDLLRVKGIGPKTLRGIEERVAVDYAEPCGLSCGSGADAPSRMPQREANESRRER